MTNGPGATPLPVTFLGLTIATTLNAGLRPRSVAFAGAFYVELRSALSRT